MLRKEDFVYYGKFLKPHGTKGEIGLLGDSMTLGEDCDYVAADIDGILVPFFFKLSITSLNNSTLIGSNPEKGSSNISNLGSLIIADINCTFC